MFKKTGVKNRRSLSGDLVSMNTIFLWDTWSQMYNVMMWK